MKESEVEKARVNYRQLRLFSLSPRQLCRQIGLNWLAALRLRDAGWLSFDPEAISDLNEAQEAELTFLGSLVATGCDEQMLEQLLEGLKKPYSYRISELYYAWHEKGWRLLPSNTPTLEMVEEWIEDMVADENLEALTEVYEKIENAISRLATDENGEQEAEE